MSAPKLLGFAVLVALLVPVPRSLAQNEGTLEDAKAHKERGTDFFDHRDLDGALREWEAARSIYERLAPESLDCAACYRGTGRIYTIRGSPEEALDRLEKARAIDERLASGSEACAEDYGDIGVFYGIRGDRDRALAWFAKALAIDERLGPDSRACAADYTNIGICHSRRGDLDGALEHYRRALAIQERLAPDSLDCAGGYHNIALVCLDLGDLDRALEYFQRALAIRERIAPDSLDCAACYTGAACVYQSRGDPDRALQWYEKGLAIEDRVAPNSLWCAATYQNMAMLYRERGDLDRSLELSEKARTIEERLTPASLSCADTYNNMCLVYMFRGDLRTALEYAEKSLAIRERRAPNSLECAISYGNIGEVARRLGDAERAIEAFRKSLPMTRSLAPFSSIHVLSCRDAAMLYAALGRADEARQLFAEALDALDTAREHAAKPGEEEARRGLSGKYESVYRRDIEFLLGIEHDSASALVVLERMRAKGLRENLFQRMTALADEGERRVLAKREELLGQREAVVTRLGRAEGNKELEAQLLAHRERIDTDWGTLIADARQGTPRLAAVLFPAAEGVEDLQRLLDPETVSLSYVVASGGVQLLVLTNTGPVEHITLPATAQEIQALLFPPDAARAGDYRWVSETRGDRAIMMAARGIPMTDRAIMMAARDSGPRYLHPEILDDTCRKLWSALIGPVAKHLEGKKRVIVVADGVLHYVPWAALADADGKPLISRVAVVMLPSLRTLGLLRQDAEARAAARTGDRQALLALGNPDYPEPAAGISTPGRTADELVPISTPETIAEALGRPDVRIPRLPNTAGEVARIGDALGCPEGVHTGSGASERTARAGAHSAKVLHFACHGYSNDRSPMASGLVLSLTGTDPKDPTNDGLLTAEDVLGLSLDADLVTLSACQTALGKESGGEGLVGLTWAFMFAGTPTVVSSLWPVADDSTSELMQRFYANMKAGMDKAEALRQAQLSLVADHPEWASPYFWAPFEVWGMP